MNRILHTNKMLTAWQLRTVLKRLFLPKQSPAWLIERWRSWETLAMTARIVFSVNHDIAGLCADRLSSCNFVGELNGWNYNFFIFPLTIVDFFRQVFHTLRYFRTKILSTATNAHQCWYLSKNYQHFTPPETIIHIFLVNLIAIAKCGSCVTQDEADWFWQC